MILKNWLLLLHFFVYVFFITIFFYVLFSFRMWAIVALHNFLFFVGLSKVFLFPITSNTSLPTVYTRLLGRLFTAIFCLSYLHLVSIKFYEPSFLISIFITIKKILNVRIWNHFSLSYEISYIVEDLLHFVFASITII